MLWQFDILCIYLKLFIFTLPVKNAAMKWDRWVTVTGIFLTLGLPLGMSNYNCCRLCNCATISKCKMIKENHSFKGRKPFLNHLILELLKVVDLYLFSKHSKYLSKQKHQQKQLKCLAVLE